MAATNEVDLSRITVIPGQRSGQTLRGRYRKRERNQGKPAQTINQAGRQVRVKEQLQPDIRVLPAFAAYA